MIIDYDTTEEVIFRPKFYGPYTLEVVVPIYANADFDPDEEMDKFVGFLEEQFEVGVDIEYNTTRTVLRHIPGQPNAMVLNMFFARDTDRNLFKLRFSEL